MIPSSVEVCFAGSFENQLGGGAQSLGGKRPGVCPTHGRTADERTVDVEIFYEQSITREAQPESLLDAPGKPSEGSFRISTTLCTVDRDADFCSRVLFQNHRRERVGVRQIALIR